MTETYSDSWKNNVTQLGRSKDKTTHTHFEGRGFISADEAEAIYTENALGGRLADRLADDATRAGFELTGDEADFPWKEFNEDVMRFGTKVFLSDTIRWSRVYGGTLDVAAINDGRKLEQPVNWEAITNIIAFHPIESPLVQATKFDAGIGSRTFRMPTRYIVNPEIGNNGGKEIHRSRTYRFDGVKVPPRVLHRSQGRARDRGWGPSVYDRVYEELRRLGQVEGYAAGIVHEASVRVLRLKDLRKNLTGGTDSKEKVRESIEAIGEMLDVFHVLAIDSEDEYVNVTRELGSAATLYDKFIDAVVRATDMPREILLGMTPGGLNSGENAGAFRAWYDHVAAFQEDQLEPLIRWVVRFVMAMRKHQGKRNPKKYEVEFADLWTPSETDKAAVRLSNSQSDNAYFLMGAVSGEEIRKQRFEDGNTGDLVVEASPDDGDLGEQVAIEIDPATGDDPTQAEGAPTSVEPVASDDEPPKDETLLGAGEIGSLLGVSAASIRSMHKRGEIRGWKIGNRWRFAASEVREAAFRPARNAEGAEV